MELTEFALLAEIISAFAIVVSLIYVGLQVNQNTNAINGATIQGVSDQSLEISLAGFNSPELRLAFLKSQQDIQNMTAQEFSIVSWFYSAAIKISENRYRQAALGNISEETLLQLGGNNVLWRHPFFLMWWDTPSGRESISEDFANWVEINLIPYVQDVTTFNSMN